MVIFLADLLANLPDLIQVIKLTGDLQSPITAPIVESDSDVAPGGVFVARMGRSVDGHQFIPEAIDNGAAAIVGEQAIDNLPVPYIQLSDAQQAVGYLAAAYHGFPSRNLTLIGITGTDGKTTTSHLLHSILKRGTHEKAGFISTIAADFGGRSVPTGLHVTTPGAPRVQEYLSQMVEAGLTHVILEMTSHGLAQGRLNGVNIDIAVLTNITHEHLDYHGTWENYRAAKGRMFDMLSQTQRKAGQPKVSIINRDDLSFDWFAAKASDQTIGYAVQNAADFQAVDIQYAPDSTLFTVLGEPIETKLFGEFNVLNCLAAIATARSLNIDWDVIREGIASVEMISGRMQRIDEGQDFTAIVDFAHTPNALKRALETGRTMLPAGKRLIAVFGSAGLRDVEKRRLMAETSAQLADMTILTAEDPRTESLDDILQMMADGCISQGGVEGETFIRVPDRGEAIYQACQMAQAGDMVMVCGKGHEQSMCFGTIEYPWDDRDATHAALRGEPLRTLPTAKG